MADTFLEMHRVGPLEFQISGPISPVSIRDQMVRAQMFVDRARAGGLISDKRSLFVLGAGAAGVTAAVYASSLQIPTTLIEMSDRAFGRQKQCLSRWIDPTQYDWPAYHWHRAVYPWTVPRVPIPWRAAYANHIAGMWMHEFRNEQLRRGSVLNVEYERQFIDSVYLQTSELLEVETAPVADPQASVKRPFGAALYALGFGAESSRCGDFKSFDFWETDDLVHPNLNLPDADRQRRVLICGDGDGALQDFLRIATGIDSAAAIWSRIGHPLNPNELNEIFTEGDQAHRAGLWNDRKQNHAVHMRWDFFLRRVAGNILSTSYQARQEIDRMLSHSGELEILLAHPCDHFTASYSLNRFLVHLLLTRAAQAPTPIIHERPRVYVARVEGVSHTCQGKPRDCFGEEHRVEFGDWPDCRDDRDTNTQSGGNFDAVVLRLGVKAPKPLREFMTLRFNRHSLPYHPAN